MTLNDMLKRIEAEAKLPTAPETYQSLTEEIEALKERLFQIEFFAYCMRPQ